MRAYFHADPLTDPLMQTVRLVVVDDRMGSQSYLGQDNQWHTIQDGEAPRVQPGIILPAAAIGAIAEAVDKHMGTAGHGSTEVRVLREWLAVEQRRVDAGLGR